MLVGHSLGGLLSLLAASRRPDLARGVVLLDAPVIAGWRAHSLQVVKASGLGRALVARRASRARGARVARARRGVREHFARKAVFARWDPRVLDDYVASGFDPSTTARLALTFDREIETRIYNTLPHHIGPLLRRHPLQCPVTFIGGKRSAEARQGAWPPRGGWWASASGCWRARTCFRWSTRRCGGGGAASDRVDVRPRESARRL